MKTNLEKLKNLVAMQCSEGNWNVNSYMHGMANGLILALSTMEENEPKFLATPKAWLDCNEPSKEEPAEENHLHHTMQL